MVKFNNAFAEIIISHGKSDAAAIKHIGLFYFIKIKKQKMEINN